MPASGTSRHAAPLAAAALLAGAALLGGCGGAGGGSQTQSPLRPAGSGFAGAALPPGLRAPRFSLADQDGRPVTLGGRSGDVTLVAFLDTGCGRACVLIAQQIRGALDRLAAPVRTLVVSVAPRADTPARIARFLGSVSLAGRVRWLTSPVATLRHVWRAYRVVTPASGRGAFERSASVLLIDRAGFERVLYQQEQLTPESLRDDIARLRGRPGAAQPG